MGFLCGDVCECKKTCKGWFPYDNDLKSGCKKLCKGSNGREPKSRSDYLTTVTEGDDILNPDSNNGNGPTNPNYIPPPAGGGESIMPWVIGGVILIVVVFGGILIFKRFKKNKGK